MVVAKSEVDADASLGDVLKVQVQLDGERCTLSVGVLDEAYSTEGEDGLGWVRVELRLCSMEGNVRSSSWVLSGRAREVDAISAVPLEEERERFEDGDGFLVDLLDGTLDLVAVGVRSGVRDVGMKEAEWGGEGSANGFRVGAECFDVVASGVVGGNELFETGHDVVLVFGLGSKD